MWSEKRLGQKEINSLNVFSVATPRYVIVGLFLSSPLLLMSFVHYIYIMFYSQSLLSLYELNILLEPELCTLKHVYVRALFE